MKCPKCGQEIIDRKDYCVSCGTKLDETKPMSKGTVIMFILLIVLLSAAVCYAVINYNTDSELGPYMNQDVVENKNN